MNERIRELANQCWDMRLDGRHFDQEKFAELIVQECMDIAKRTGDNFGSWKSDVVVGGRGGTFCVYHNIKNWFGVEE